MERNLSTKTNSTAQVSDNSIKGDSESDDIDGDGHINSIQRIQLESNGEEGLCCRPPSDHLDACLLYWKETIYPSGYKA